MNKTTSDSYIPASAAVVGCGRFQPGKEGWAQGQVHGYGYTGAFPEIKLYGVDPNPENLASFGELFGLPKDHLFASTEALYSNVKPEMVSVVTWPALHLRQVLEAVEAGVKMILCEKPVATDNSEIDTMLEACEKSGARLAVAHQRRYSPGYEVMRRLFQDGAVGSSPVFFGRVGDQWDMLSWIVHWFDMANYIFDGPPRSVLAGMDYTGNRRYQHAVENAAVIYANYENGAEGTFLSGVGAGTAEVQLFGAGGFLRLSENAVIHSGPNGVVSTPIPSGPNELFPGSGDYIRLIRDLARAWSTGEDFRCDARHCAWATRMAFAAHESASKQRVVTLPSTVKYAPLEVAQRRPRLKASRALRIVLLGDDHFSDPETGRSGRDGLIEALTAFGHTVCSVPLESRQETPDDFSEADLLAIYHTRGALTREKPGADTERLVGGWIESGRPTLIAHCGVGAWVWKEFRQWTGRYWVWGFEDEAKASCHPHCAGEIEVERRDLWTAPWVEAWIPRDEIYTNLGEAAPVEDIAWIRFDGEKHPFAWRTKEHPNVGVYLPGHRYDIWELPVIRSGLQSMIALVS